MPVLTGVALVHAGEPRSALEPLKQALQLLTEAEGGVGGEGEGEGEVEGEVEGKDTAPATASSSSSLQRKIQAALSLASREIRKEKTATMRCPPSRILSYTLLYSRILSCTPLYSLILSIAMCRYICLSLPIYPFPHTPFSIHSLYIPYTLPVYAPSQAKRSVDEGVRNHRYS